MDRIASVGVVLALAASVLFAVKSVLDLPIVEISNSTASCVRVWTPDGDGSCDRLPDRFEVVWVQ